MSRARLGALAAALITLIAVPAMAASAAITPDYITMDSATSPNTSLGQLSVDVTSTTPITTLAIHVLDPATGADLLDPAAAETSSSGGNYAPYQSTWTVTTPITTAQLPAGDYEVTVDATDQGGTVATGSAAGTWEFTPYAAVTITADNTTINYDHPTATVSGTVIVHSPDGTAAPYQGPITLTESWATAQPSVSTDASGAFSLTVTPPYTGGVGSDMVFAQVNSPAIQRGGAAGWLYFTVAQNPTKLTAALAPGGSITYGTKVTLSGSLTYQRNGTGAFVPFATSMPVGVYNNGKLALTAKTDVNGNYSVTLPSTAGTTWSAQFSPASDLLAVQQVARPLTVTIPTVFTGFKGSVTSRGALKLSACLGFTTSVPGLSLSSYYFQEAGSFQYSAHKSGPWYNYPYPAYGGGCGHGGYLYSITGSAPYNAAYYRVTFSTIRDASQYYTIYHSTTSGMIYLKVP